MKLTHAVATAVLATVMTTSVAEAQTTLYGCYVKNTGTVYRIKTPGTPTQCGANHTEFSWNKEGQVGPQGPQGPEGPAGPSGWTGVIRRDALLYVQPGNPMGTTVFCGPGQVLLSGGYASTFAPADFHTLTSMPHYAVIGNVPESGWRVAFQNNTASQVVVSVYAWCKTAP